VIKYSLCSSLATRSCSSEKFHCDSQKPQNRAFNRENFKK
jgi:hypothetical protein